MEYKKGLPLYKPVNNKRSSSEIIEEARRELKLNHQTLRPVNTKRPETPLDDNIRRLFRQNSVGDLRHRPDSVVSVGSRHFDAESRPSSGNIRLTPLPIEPKVRIPVSVETDSKIAPRPPTDPRKKNPIPRLRTCQPLSPVESLDHLNRSSVGSRAGSLQDVSQLVTNSEVLLDSPDEIRRVRSGPTERSPINPHDKRDVKTRTRMSENLALESGYASGDAVNCHEAAGEGKLVEDISEKNGRSGDAKSAKEPLPPQESSVRKSSAGSRRVTSADKQRISSGKREDVREEPIDEDVYFNSVVAPILQGYAVHAKEKNVSKLIELSGQLYSALDRGNMLGKSSAHRTVILKSIYQLLDLESSELLLKLARMILAMKVSGKNLLNVCKLIFKVSQDKENDKFFQKDNILQLLIDVTFSTDPTTSTDASESLVFCLASLKFLSVKERVKATLASRSNIECLARLLSMIQKLALKDESSNEYLNLCIQLTAVLRNIIDVSGTTRNFMSLGLLDDICAIMASSIRDHELMLNISRILGKMTLHSDCCSAVASNPTNIRFFLEILAKFPSREDLVLRVCFIVGNLMAKHEDARRCLVEQLNGLPTLYEVYSCYLKRYRTLSSEKSSSDVEMKMVKKVEDILVKIVRVIANLSLTEDVGEVIAKRDKCIDLLMQTLGCCSLESSEELVLNSMATINNLSYYNVEDSSVMQKRMEVAKALLKYTQTSHKESLAEAIRVFGNLSRERNVRDFLVKYKIDEAMVELLDSEDRELVFAACGVLINIMADEDKRRMLYHQEGIQKLIAVLQEFGKSDWQLAGMVCQTLWNYSSKLTSTNACFGPENGQELAELLAEYLDEDAAIEESSEEMREYFRSTWESEFVPVASDLLHRIDSHQSALEPLTNHLGCE